MPQKTGTKNNSKLAKRLKLLQFVYTLNRIIPQLIVLFNSKYKKILCFSNFLKKFFQQKNSQIFIEKICCFVCFFTVLFTFFLNYNFFTSAHKIIRLPIIPVYALINVKFGFNSFCKIFGRCEVILNYIKRAFGCYYIHLFVFAVEHIIQRFSSHNIILCA